MKTTKKQVVETVPKKDLNGNSSSKIKSYFKVTPKSFFFEKKIDEVFDETRAIYVQALEDKLKNFESDVPNQNEVNGEVDGAIGVSNEDEVNGEDDGAVGYDANGNENPLLNIADIEVEVISSNTDCTGCNQKTAEYIELDGKHKALKKVYFTLTSHYAELSIKYDALLKAKSHINEINVGEETELNGDFFTKNELKFLQCMSLDKPKDSTFILQCLEFAYKGNLSVMHEKTLKGTSESVKVKGDGTVQNIPSKAALSPIKVVRIKELFLERISKCQIDSVVYSERASESNLNKLIASGIKNIAKKQAKL